MGSAIRAAGRAGVFLDDQEVAELLCAAQEEQDRGVPWGEAVSRAIAAAKPDVAV
jgi:hypothetical protein